MIFITASPAQAGECPREGLSNFCCSVADPLDAIERSEGGYGWHPGPSETAGLCQGLASRNVSGALIELQDLRETENLTTTPDNLVVGYRPLPWSLNRSVVFQGTPLTNGNNYFIAGSFENGNNVVWWDTTPFSQTGQRLSSFGFVAVAMYKGRRVYTPLVFREVRTSFADRAKVRFVLRSTKLIESAAITMEPLDPDTLDRIGDKRTPLPYTQLRPRMLRVELLPQLPEAFLVLVAICTVDKSNCHATEDSPPTQSFRIFWPTP